MWRYEFLLLREKKRDNAKARGGCTYADKVVAHDGVIRSFEGKGVRIGFIVRTRRDMAEDG